MLKVGSLSLIGGTISGTDDIVVTGAVDFSNGTLRGFAGRGSLRIQSNTTFNNSSAVHNFTLINSAIMKWTGGTLQFFGSTGGFVNAAGAAFDDQIDGSFGSVDGNCIRFTNDGHFIKSGGTGITYLQMQLYNRGTVEIHQPGQIYLGCGYVSTNPTPPGEGIVLPPGIPPIYEPPGDLPLPPTVPVVVPGSFTQTVIGVLIEQIAGHTGPGIYGTPGTDYGQLVVNGDVALNGSFTVQLINGFVPTTDQQFLVIDNRGSKAITGTFIDLPEATVFTVGVRLFQISYVGRNGNDVTLTDVGPSITSVTVSGGTFTYDGLAHGATSSSVTAANGFTAVPTLVYYVGTDISGTGSPLAPLDAGVYTVVAGFAGDSSHNPGSASATITINKATQTIVWSSPSAINYGTPLSGTQLNATVFGATGGSAPGTLTYTPPSGTVLLARTQTLTVTAAETTNYLAATTSVALVVNNSVSYTSTGFLEPIRPNRALNRAARFPSSGDFMMPAATS